MEKIREKEDIILAVLFGYLLLTSFINQTVYDVVGRYASVIVFIVLCFLLFLHAGEILERKDIKAVAAVIAIVVTGINLIVIGSNKGAFFIPSDLCLICVASFYVRLREKTKTYITGLGSILTILWYSYVRWDYNFNMAGLTFMLFMMMGVTFLEFLKKEKTYDYLTLAQILMYVTAFLYATLYHSRCAMAGILVFGGCILIRRLLVSDRLLFTILLILTTAGSVLFTMVYVVLAERGAGGRFLYKDLFSGRHLIWKELWSAYFAHPITGIGSSYALKSFDIFEVHNGLFDILVVHGTVVFFLVLILIAAAMNGAHMGKENRKIKGFAFAALFGMLTASFFENFFTVPPYSVFFLIFLLAGREADSQIS
ncbi:MAG: O-antigen ligase family protein [Lachnospiraceae bacterium]|nr:O-antigen ligase family protein [Lachnospiraceae bacterium]